MFLYRKMYNYLNVKYIFVVGSNDFLNLLIAFWDISILNVCSIVYSSTCLFLQQRIIITFFMDRKTYLMMAVQWRSNLLLGKYGKKTCFLGCLEFYGCSILLHSFTKKKAHLVNRQRFLKAPGWHNRLLYSVYYKLPYFWKKKKVWEPSVLLAEHAVGGIWL